MIRAFGVFTNKGVQFVIRLDVGTGLDFAFHKRLKSLLGENLAGQADAIAEFLPVAILRHIVKDNLGSIRRIARPQRNSPAREGPHRTDMGLKPVPFRRSLAVIAHRNRQKVILDIRILDPRLGSNKGGGFKLV